MSSVIPYAPESKPEVKVKCAIILASLTIVLSFAAGFRIPSRTVFYTVWDWLLQMTPWLLGTAAVILLLIPASMSRWRQLVFLGVVVGCCTISLIPLSLVITSGSNSLVFANLCVVSLIPWAELCSLGLTVVAYCRFACIAEAHDWVPLTFEGMILAASMGLLGLALLLWEHPWGTTIWYHTEAFVPVAGYTRPGVLLLRGGFVPPARIWYCICPADLWALLYLARLFYRLHTIL